MLELDRCVSVLMQHGGRDKVTRTIYYALMFVAGRSKNQMTVEKLMAMAKQLSATRLITRQFNDLPMIRANLSHFSNPPKKGEDKVSYELQSAVNVLYLLYTPLEHIAWLSDLKLLPFDSARWFRYSLYVWTAALICSIMRSLRVYFGIQRRRAALEFEGELSDAKKRLALEEQEELLSLLSFTTDFINAVNFLPFKGFLWAQTFPAWKTGAFGFIASFAGLLKIYRATKRH